MKILITGFVPFAGMKVNPSEELVQALLNESCSFDLIGQILPVSFARAFPIVKELISEHKPSYVISFGVATNRTIITPGRIAINLRKSETPDDDGYTPIGEKIFSESEDGLFSSLPVDQMVNACLDEGVDAKSSNSAGTYVCNDLMYKVIKASRSDGFKAGFIHVPPLAGTEGSESTMTLDELKLGVVQMLNALPTYV